MLSGASVVVGGVYCSGVCRRWRLFLTYVASPACCSCLAVVLFPITVANLSYPLFICILTVCPTWNEAKGLADLSYCVFPLCLVRVRAAWTCVSTFGTYMALVMGIRVLVR